MTERERLKELLKDGLMEHIGKSCNLAEKLAAHLLDELAELIRAKQGGRIIVPPCKMGDTVWWADAEYGEPLKGEVVGFSLHTEGLWAHCRYNCGLTYWHLVSDYFGKTVFLTQEEAEKALKGAEDERN